MYWDVLIGGLKWAAEFFWALITSGLLWAILKFFAPLLLLALMVKLLPIITDRIRYEIAIRKRKGYQEKKYFATQNWHSDRQLLWMLRGMNPAEFEEYIAELFSKMGFQTKAVGGSYDHGVDVVAEKNGIKHYIQCKKYFGKREAGVGEVRDFYGAIADHLAQGKGYFITTNKFTLEAERFAEDKPIELVDSFKLIKYIKSVEKQDVK
jgi:restriction endonuclease Mrr